MWLRVYFSLKEPIKWLRTNGNMEITLPDCHRGTHLILCFGLHFNVIALQVNSVQMKKCCELLEYLWSICGKLELQRSLKDILLIDKCVEFTTFCVFFWQSIHFSSKQSGPYSVRSGIRLRHLGIKLLAHPVLLSKQQTFFSTASWKCFHLL